MKAIISRLRLSPILLIGCLLILPSTAPQARASEAKPHGSAEDMPPGLREAVSAAREREARSIYAADTTGLGEIAIPKGLTDSDWKSIREVYERHRHAAVAVDGKVYRSVPPSRLAVIKSIPRDDHGGVFGMDADNTDRTKEKTR